MKAEHKTKQKQSDGLNEFLNYMDVILLSRVIRNMFIDYLLFNKDALPIDFEQSVYQLSLLFNFFDEIEDEK